MQELWDSACGFTFTDSQITEFAFQNWILFLLTSGGASYGHDSSASDGSDQETGLDGQKKVEISKEKGDYTQGKLSELKPEGVKQNILKVNSQPNTLPQERYDPNRLDKF